MPGYPNSQSVALGWYAMSRWDKESKPQRLLAPMFPAPTGPWISARGETPGIRAMKRMRSEGTPQRHGKWHYHGVKCSPTPFADIRRSFRAREKTDPDTPIPRNPDTQSVALGWYAMSRWDKESKPQRLLAPMFWPQRGLGYQPGVKPWGSCWRPCFGPNGALDSSSG